MKYKLFTIVIALVANIGTILASDTQVDGIWYNFDSDSKTASVTYRCSSSTSYSSRYIG